MNFKNTGNSTSLCTTGRIKYRIFWDAFWSTRRNSNTFRPERHYCYSHYSWNFFFPPSTMMFILTETQRFSRKTDYERGSRREEIRFEQHSTAKYYYEWLFQMGRQEDKHWQKKFHVHRSQLLTHSLTHILHTAFDHTYILLPAPSPSKHYTHEYSAPYLKYRKSSYYNKIHINTKAI